LHLNGYKISAPTVYGRKSERELNELVRGFGYTPLVVTENVEDYQMKLAASDKLEHPFLIMKTEKGAGGPGAINDQKVAGNYLAHQIPLPNAKTDESQLKLLEEWLKSYNFEDIYSMEEGILI
jgi:xylulose-5-phosphate/fructose-6-phosphate phosphoketolase